jgi:hypothetical protein
MNAIVTRLRILPRTGFCNCRGSGYVPDPPCLLTLQPFATPRSGRTGPGATSPTRASRHRAVLGLPRARGLSSWCRSMPRGTCIGSSAWSTGACSGAGPPRRAIPRPVGQAPGRLRGGPPSRLRVVPGQHPRWEPRFAARGTEPAPRFACRATRIRSSECGGSPHSLVTGFFARAFGTRRLDWVKGSRSACPRWVSARPRRPSESC